MSHLCVGENGRKRLVQLVRDRRGHLADGRDSRDVRKFLAAAPRVDLRAAQLGDLGADDHGPSARPVQRDSGDGPPLRASAIRRMLDTELAARVVQHGGDPFGDRAGQLIAAPGHRAPSFNHIAAGRQIHPVALLRE